MIIDDRILEQLEFVAGYVQECDDWIEVKKQIMRGVPSNLRKLFSTRDPVTKEQSLNDFEKQLISIWYKKTGVKLKLRSLEERRDLFLL